MSKIFEYIFVKIPSHYMLSLALFMIGLSSLFQPQFIFNGYFFNIDYRLNLIYGFLFIFCAGGLIFAVNPSPHYTRVWSSPLIVHVLIVIFNVTALVVLTFYTLAIYYLIKDLFVKPPCYQTLNENESVEIKLTEEGLRYVKRVK